MEKDFYRSGDLLPALKPRLADSNKNLAVQAVEICGLLAAAMGSSFEKYIRIVLPGVISNLNDNKTNVRAAGLKSLDVFTQVVSLDCMMTTIGASLLPDSPNLRKDLLNWLADNASKATEKCDMNSLVTPLLSCLQDRSQEVRKAAQTIMPMVVRHVGYDHVREKCTDLKGAVAQSILPILDACREAGSVAAQTSASSLGSGKSPVSPQKSLKRPSTAQSSSASLSRAGSSRLVLKKKLTSASSSSASLAKESLEPSVEAEPPVLTGDIRLKEKRSENDRGIQKWTFDAPRKELIDLLRDQMEGNLSATIVRLLFSEDHHKEKDHIFGLSVLDEYLVQPELATERFSVDVIELKMRFVANSDLILKYLTIRFFDSNTSILLKVLDVVEHLFAVVDDQGSHLLEYEAAAFLPFFINKVD